MFFVALIAASSGPSFGAAIKDSACEASRGKRGLRRTRVNSAESSKFADATPRCGDFSPVPLADQSGDISGADSLLAADRVEQDHFTAFFKNCRIAESMFRAFGFAGL